MLLFPPVAGAGKDSLSFLPLPRGENVSSRRGPAAPTQSLWTSAPAREGPWTQEMAPSEPPPAPLCFGPFLLGCSEAPPPPPAAARFRAGASSLRSDQSSTAPGSDQSSGPRFWPGPPRFSGPAAEHATADAFEATRLVRRATTSAFVCGEQTRTSLWPPGIKV